ncbi:MAG: hypothetical protein QXD43_03765 [Candidatus Aenigmatarchaeota archaeon]
MFKKILYFIFISLFFIFLIIILTYPACFHLNDKLIGDGGDNYQFLSFQYIAYKNISKGIFPFSWSNVLRFPYGFDFSRGYDGTYAVLGGALLNFILNNKVLSYNLVVFSIFFLNCLFSYLLFQKITRSSLLGIIGATIYGFSFYVIARAAGHINLLFIGGFPLLFYAVLLLKEKQSLLNFILIPTAILLIAFGSVQYLLFLLIFTLFFLLISFFFYRNEIYQLKRVLINNINKVIIASIYFIFIFLLFYFPYIDSLFIKHTFVFPNSKLQFFDLKPEIYDYILPNPFLKNLLITKLWKNSYQAKIDKVVFLGFGELIAFLYFLTSRSNKRLKLYLLTMVSVFIGIPHLIYPHLYSYFPFSTTAEISRYYVFYYLFLTIGSVLGLSSIRLKKRYVLIIIFFILIILERFSTNFYLSDINEWKRVYNIVKQQSTEGVVILPLSNWYSKYNLLPVFTDKKLVDGYIHWSANDEDSNKFIQNCGEMNRFNLESEKIPIELFSNKQFIQKEIMLNKALINCLKQNNIRIIVFDKYYRVYWDDFRHLLARTTLLFPHVSIINNTAGVTKLETTRWAADKLHYSLYFPKKGIFHIYQIHYSNPSKKPILKLTYNENEIKINDWQTSLNFEWNRWTRRIIPPNNFFSISIDAGTLINFNSDEYTSKDGFLNIWYEFIEDKQSPIIIPFSGPLEKLYEDEKVEIWKIN